MTTGRGVWSPPWRGSAGERIAVAIDSRGRLVGYAPIFDPDHESVILSYLHEILEAQDPSRPLKLL